MLVRNARLGYLAIIALVFLRFVIGFHFYMEGTTKVREGGFSSTGFLASAKGPLAKTFQSMVPDFDGSIRLDTGKDRDKPDSKDDYRAGALKQVYDGFIEDASRLYKFTEEQQKEAKQFVEEARKQLVDFAGPYYVAGQDILARKDDIRNGRIRGVADANGRRVCSVTGSTSLANLRAAAPQADTSITADKYSECFEALKQGRVDAMTTDDVILLGLAQGHPEFALTGNPFHTEPYGIGVKKGDFEARLLVNRVLQSMFDDGRWAEAFRTTVGTSGALIPPPPELDQEAK